MSANLIDSTSRLWNPDFLTTGSEAIMADTPMDPIEVHNAIVDMRAQLYSIETMVARLYLGLAHAQPDAQKFLDEALAACLRDVGSMNLTPPYRPESARNMRNMIETRLREQFNAITLASAKPGRN